MPEADRTNRANQIRSAREGRGWSVAELARRSGVSRSVIAQIEGGGGARDSSLDTISRTLGLELVVRERRPGR